MKYFYLTFFCFFTTFTLFAHEYKLKINEAFIYHQEGKFYENYTDKPFSGLGIIKEKKKLIRANITNGLMNGTASVYSNNGKLLSKITFKNNIKNGSSKNWNENGILTVDVTYVNNEICDGWEKTYDTNLKFVNCKKSGIERSSVHPKTDKYLQEPLQYNIYFKNDKIVKISKPTIFNSGLDE